MGHAKVILGLPGPSEQQRVAQLVVAKPVGERNGKNPRVSGPQKKRGTKEFRRTPWSDVEERLQKRLGTKVMIRKGKSGGKIVIHYFSPPELDGILEIILN